MTFVMPGCPSPASWQLDFASLVQEVEWLPALALCPQDPRHHAEGDVLTHTRMVLESLAQLPAFRALDDNARNIVYAGALLHDVGKPETTKHEADGSISSRGHSRRGEILARQILWRMQAPFVAREAVTQLIRYHQVPFFLIDRDDRRKTALRISQSARCDWLALVAEADMRGRVAPDQQRILDQIALFVELCRDEGCLDRPRPFPSPIARYEYFRRAERDPDYAAHDDYDGELILLSGLPGAGKDHVATTRFPDLPMVSLDRWRARLDVDPGDAQKAVVHAAQEEARQLLRQKQRFVVNGTNLSRDLRQQWLALADAYHARTRIVYVEAAAPRQRRQNRERAQPVPEAALARMLDRWEVPDATEAHAIDFVVDP